MIVKIAHDFLCPWCWIALSQSKRLKEEFGVEIEWIGYEMFPDNLDWPTPPAPPVVESNRPKTPSRLDLAFAAEGMEPPTAQRPKRMRIHNALEAAEYAKTFGAEKAEKLIEGLYKALYLEGKEINQPEVIAEIAAPIIGDTTDLLKAIEERRFSDRIVPFDDEAYRSGVYNVPTFMIGDVKLAEQPYQVIRKALLNDRS